MRVAVLGVIFASLVVVAISAQVGRSTVYAQRPSGSPGLTGDQLIALTSDVDQTHQQVTIIDSKSRVMSVYHIDRKSGEVALKSVRNVNWDLQMEEFNGVSPSPREIRSLLEQR